MRLVHFFILILGISISNACDTPNENNDISNFQDRRFSIQDFDNYTQIQVRDAWQNSSKAKFTYILSENINNIPDSLSEFKFIKIPVKRVVVFSTTRVGFLLALEEGNSIIAASGRKYIYDEDLKFKVAQNEIKEIGFAPNINYESKL